jgi:hypothetical protein
MRLLYEQEGKKEERGKEEREKEEKAGRQEGSTAITIYARRSHATRREHTDIKRGHVTSLDSF